MSSGVSAVASILAAFALGVVTNWAYDILKDRGYFPTNPNIKRLVVAFFVVLPILVFVVALPEIHSATPSDTLTSDRVAACMTAHAMTRPKVIDRGEDVSSEVFRSCEWPPPSYADPDGYSEISHQRVPGPDYNRDDITMAVVKAAHIDRIQSPCTELEISYSFGRQGWHGYQPSFRVSPGSVVDPRGDPFTFDEEAIRLGNVVYFGFVPQRSEVLVISNYGWTLEQVSCVP